MIIAFYTISKLKFYELFIDLRIYSSGLNFTLDDYNSNYYDDI